MNTINVMDRRYGNRISTDFTLRVYRDGHALEARSVDLSPTGALIRHRSIRSWPMVQKVELELGGRPVQTLARTAWCFGDLHAVHFVGLSDVDRLEIAEHLDRTG